MGGMVRRRVALAMAPVLVASLLVAGTVAVRPEPAMAAEPPPGGLVPSQSWGWNEGQFSVSDDGAAHYDLPLWTPPGRGGLEPELSLSYHSRSGNGLAGVGWSLRGFTSRITPCPRTVAQDGVLDPVKYDATDVYCLDGNRLRPTGPVVDGQREYRTEEATHARIVSYGAAGAVPNYFRMWTKEGQVLTFGQPRDVFIYTKLHAYQLMPDGDGPGLVRKPGPRVVAAWLLDQVEDRNGNSMSIHYQQTESFADDWSVDLRPESIHYAPGRSVVLSYDEERPDPIDRFEHGIHTRTGERISAISMYDGESGSPSALLRQYRLDYRDDSSSGRSLLRRVTECDVDGVCLKPIEFQWSLGGFEFDDITTGVTDAGIIHNQVPFVSRGRIEVADINGDGKDDLHYPAVEGLWYSRLGVGNGHFNSRRQSFPGYFEGYKQDARLIDFDRNGKTDIMAEVVPPNCECDGSPFTEYTMYESTSGSVRPEFAAYEPDLDQEHVSFWSPVYRDPAYFLDLDGNGMPDYVTPRASGTPIQWHYRLNSGSADDDRFGEMVETSHLLGHYDPLPGNDPTRFVRVLDSDGDGRQELLQLQAGVSPARFETFGVTDGEVTVRRDPINIPVRDAFGTELYLADVNGDGLVDAVHPFDGLRVQLNSGNGYGDYIEGPPGYDAPAPSTTSDFNVGVRTADVTNDGAEDVLILRDGEPVTVYTWRDGQFVRISLGHDAIQQTNGAGFPATQLLDVNADNVLDIIYSDDETAGTMHVLRRSAGEPDKLVGVGVETVGPRVEVDYTTLANRGVHTPGTDCAYPVSCPVRGDSVVMMHRLWNGTDSDNDGWNTFYHDYQAARVDLTGRGWLGFEGHTVIDDRADTATVTELDNSTRAAGSPTVYPFAHLPEAITVAVGTDDDTENRHITSNDYELRRLPQAGTHTVELRTVTETEQERAVGATAWTTLRENVTSAAYDEFGNTDLSLSITTGGRMVIEDPEYLNDTSAWLIGLPTHLRTQACTQASGGTCTMRDSTITYDDRGNPTVLVTEPSRPELTLTTATEYGEYGVVTSVASTDGAGSSHTSTIEYDDEFLFPIAAVNALGHRSTTETHHGLGVTLRIADPNGVPATMRYDKFGRLRETYHADGSFERTDYRVQAGTHFAETTFADGSATRTLLDALGREAAASVRSFSGDWATAHTTHDQLGRVSAMSRPALPGEAVHDTTYEYDQLGRLTRQTDPDDVVTRHEYSGRETHTYDGRGIHSYVVTSVDGDPESSYEDDPASAQWLRTRFEYGPFGEPTKTVAADGTTKTMEYDVLGRRKRLIDPASTGTTITTYTAFGEIATETNGAGDVTEYRYDALSRLRSVTSPDGVATYRWDTAPNGIGKPVNSRSADGVGTNYRYDPLGRPSTTTWVVEDTQYQVAYGYDEIGRQDSLTYPEIPGADTPRFEVNYQYNPFGYLEQVSDAATGTPYWTGQGRDAAGQLTNEQFGNGVVNEYTYRELTGLLSAMTSTGPGTVGTIGEITYSYDDNRNVTDRWDRANNHRDRFFHDELNRIDRWITVAPTEAELEATYTYDQVGNLKAETFQRAGVPQEQTTYGHGENGSPAHAMTSRNNGAYGYDGAGRQISGDGRTVEYTHANLPSTMTWSHGDRTTEFAYDANGTRILKRDDNHGLISIGGLYERRAPAASGQEIHNIHNVYVDGRVVAQVNRIQDVAGGPVLNAGTFYLHGDLLGSTSLVTNRAGRPAGEPEGSLREQFYDPFGRRMSAEYRYLADGDHDGSIARFGFTGQEHDDEFGLINMGGRIYDPEARRFLTPDPVVAEPMSSQAHNRYAYVRNNPTTMTDPTGFEGCAGSVLNGDCPDESTEDPETVVTIVPGDGREPIDDVLSGAEPAPSAADDQPSQPGRAQPDEPITVAGETIEITGNVENINGDLYWKEYDEFLAEFASGERKVYQSEYVWLSAKHASQVFRSPRAESFYRSIGALERVMGGATAVACLAVPQCRALMGAEALEYLGLPPEVLDLVDFKQGLKHMGGKMRGKRVDAPSLGDRKHDAVPSTRNGRLAGKTHPVTGVPFDKNGYPDFSAWRHPTVSDVRIELSGNRATDFARANRAAGLDRTPSGYTWHHHQDAGLMQLIDRSVHRATGHTGGFSTGGLP
jgi:RHS repeat-associated protein